MNLKYMWALIYALIFFTGATESFNKKPRLTVIMVVDQFAYSYLPKLSPYLKNGIKFLMQHGVVYENAYYPHAMPSTAPGHTDLSAGITADYTGIIGNNWFDELGNKIAADDDDPQQAAVINPRGGVYDYGKGPRNIMVDNISDQYVLAQEPGMPRVAISLSIKSRSAICTANKLGKAIWLDTESGNFTSSKAYYEKLPNWLVSFNQQKRLSNLRSVTWPLYYPRNSQLIILNILIIINIACGRALSAKHFRLIGAPKIHYPYMNAHLRQIGSYLILHCGVSKRTYHAHHAKKCCYGYA